MRNKFIEAVEQGRLRKTDLQFDIGDTVSVGVKIIEGTKERVQPFIGTVISRKGRGLEAMFTVRRIVNNEGVERIYPVHSPFIASITVKRSGERRRAKLFYLRDRVGKSVRLTEKRKTKKEEPSANKGEPKAELAGAAS